MNLTKTSAFRSSYSDPEFETYYENLEKDLSIFEIQAKQEGLINSPLTQRQYIIRVIKPIKSAIQKAIDFNCSRNQMYSDIAVVQSLRTNALDKTSTLEREKNEKERKLRFLQNELKSLKKLCKRGLSTIIRIIISGLFGICEGLLVFNTLTSSSLPISVAFSLSLLTALVAGFGLHLGANFICKALTVFERKKRYILILAGAFCVSYALGVWRAHSYNDFSNVNSQIDLDQQVSASSNFSPWPFVIISFMSFVVALAFEVKYWISDKEKRQLKECQEKAEEIENERLAIASIKKAIEAIVSNSDSDSSFVMHRQEYACRNESRLLSLAQYVVSRYEGINVEFRKDNQCPDFFGKPIDFDFKLYFTQLFNSIKEKQ